MADGLSIWVVRLKNGALWGGSRPYTFDSEDDARADVAEIKSVNLYNGCLDDCRYVRLAPAGTP